MKTSDDELAVQKVSEQLLDAAVLIDRSLEHFNKVISESTQQDGLAAAAILALQSANHTISKASEDLTKVVGE